MNTLHFKYAVEVEKTHSITQAADNLFMAQPNLSKAIKELEETLGIMIFERSSKGVLPTPKGTEFLKYAKNILSQIEKMESLHTSDDHEKQSFSVSIPHGSYIAHGFTKFAADLDINKEIDVTIQETNTINTITSIVEGQVNLGIIRFQTHYENYFMNYLKEKDMSYEIIWKFEYLVLMSKDHPLAKKDIIQFDELSNYIEIKYGDDVIPYLSVDEIKKPNMSNHAKKRININDRCCQFDMLSYIPTTYMWGAPIPKELLDRYGIVQRKCKHVNCKYKDLLVYPNVYKFTELDKKFTNKIFAAKNEVAFAEYN